VLAVADRRLLLAYVASNANVQAQACQCMHRRSGSEIRSIEKRLSSGRIPIYRRAYHQENTQAMACVQPITE
jgi:hypothetical protein